MSTTLQPLPWSYPDEPDPQVAEDTVLSRDDEKRYARTQLQLIWLRFLRNRAALVGGTIIVVMYLLAIFGGFVAPYDADQRFDSAIYAPPQMIYLVDDGRIYPHVLGLKSVVDRRDAPPHLRSRPVHQDPDSVLRQGDALQPVRPHPDSTPTCSACPTTRRWASSCSGPTARGATSSRGC